MRVFSVLLWGIIFVALLTAIPVGALTVKEKDVLLDIQNDVPYTFTSENGGEIDSETGTDSVSVLVFVNVSSDTSYFMIDDINNSIWAADRKIRVAAIDVTGAASETLALREKLVDRSSIALVSDKNQSDTAEQFAEKCGLEFKNLSFPFTVILDQNQDIRYALEGYRSPDTLQQYIQKIRIDPQAPKDFVVENSLSTGAVVSWSPNFATDGYSIYRSQTKEGNYKEIFSGTDVSQNKFVDTGLELGKIYYYRIRSFLTKKNGEALWGEYSDPVAITAQLQAPDGVRIRTMGGESASVFWNSVPEATSYIVYQMESETGMPYEIGRVQKGKPLKIRISMADVESPQIYRVRACKGDNYSVLSLPAAKT